MTDRTLIHSARIVDESTVTDAWILFSDGRIIDRGVGEPPVVDGALSRIDAARATLVPGFVDIHCHGGGGADASEGREAAATVLETHLAAGTTRSVLSLVSAPVPTLVAQAERLRGLERTHPGFLGVHAEGPFLAPARCGAHDPAALRAPDSASVDALLGLGTLLRQITIAPELDGALVATERFADAEVRVAVGHTDADADTAAAAFENGATLLTHAFNAMRGIHHRAPGPILAALDHPGVTLEIIADGVHVDPRVIQLVMAADPGRFAFVSDAMAATGSSDGEYTLGPLRVLVTDGVARLAEGDSIAGSTLTLDRAIRVAVAAGVPLVDAVRAATRTPAAAIGQAGIGSLEIGSAADAVLLDADLRPTHVWQGGELMVNKEGH